MTDSFVSLACSILIHNNKLSLDPGRKQPIRQSLSKSFVLHFAHFFWTASSNFFEGRCQYCLIQKFKDRVHYNVERKHPGLCLKSLVDPIQISTRKLCVLAGEPRCHSTNERGKDNSMLLLSCTRPSINV